MVRWIVAALACCAAGAAQAQVRLVRDSGAVAGCTRLTEITGSSLIGGALGQVGYENMLSEMREKTTAAGGNHLLLIDVQSGMMGNRGIGEAYRCEPEAAPAARKKR
ncbi:hypothetical protein ABID82_002287 [Methylobacterium sp. PvP062]|uniref:DUF4156 domain-containing protein n=1 Tax=Methylobacterium radiotolerans TaxID=31998 RepID=A0ABV2NN14_9HYPH|nr:MULTISPECIES: hypothetical protein [unclassified Methylobacterium]MBP2495380.1 hypothetical protein [Methylobacterium sp. PvP105]MBP2504749.1 hypothetical protein [Methylobacterium sp. PvP109]MCX7335759.1 hypothetical protein [Hyphomicrobiales bacterium]